MAEVDEDNVDVVINAIKDSNFEFLAISDCVEHIDQLKSSQFSQKSVNSGSQKVLTQIVEETGGFLCHIDHAESQLLTFQKKKNRTVPWNATLSIGSRLKIDISAYVSIQEEKFLAPFKSDSTIANTVTRMFTDYQVNNEEQPKPDAEDIVKGFIYGSELVIVDRTEYNETEKCLACLCFTKRSNVFSEHFAGSDCHIVLPQKLREKSAKLFTGLVHTLLNRDSVMIARKVYRNGLKPSLVVLLPDLRDGVPFFTMIQLPFANDVTLFSFPRLETKKSEPSKEQKEAIKELVDSMDLMTAVDDDSGMNEAFALETSLNPVNQHLCRTVAFRALHPSDPLPTIDNELVSTIDVPPKVKSESSEVIKKIEELFPLEMVEQKVKKLFGKRTESLAVDDAMEIDSTDVDEGKKIIAIGTVSPAEDFGYLLKRGEQFNVLAEQMQTVIYDLIFRTASMQTQKVLETIMMYREQSKIYTPFNYNK